MLEEFSYYKTNGLDFVKIKTLEGVVQTVDVGAIVGFCYCDTHKGYITVNLMKSHDCLGKECPFLHRFEDFPYWERYKNVARQREIQKRQKRQKAFIKKKEENRLEIIKNMAQIYAGRLFFPILITSVTRINSHRYIVNYVSEDRYNDWSEYFSLALMLREHFNGGTYILNHIKTPDGYYATINDFYNRKK